MTDKRKETRNGLIKIAAKQLGNEYLNQLEAGRSDEEYKKIVASGLERLREVVGQFTSESVTITMKEYEERIFEEIIIQYSIYLFQTESYNPPVEELKTVMKVALIQENINEMANESIKEVNAEYALPYLVFEAVKLV